MKKACFAIALFLALFLVACGHTATETTATTESEPATVPFVTEEKQAENSLIDASALTLYYRSETDLVLVRFSQDAMLSTKELDFLKSDVCAYLQGIVGQTFELSDTIKEISAVQPDGYLIYLDMQSLYRTDSFVSITFEGILNLKTAAYPIHLFYSANLDPTTGEKILFSDRFVVEEALYQAIEAIGNREFKILCGESWDPEKISVSALCPQEKFLTTLQENTSHGEVCFYETEDFVGFSFSVPFVMGNHWEVELPRSSFESTQEGLRYASESVQRPMSEEIDRAYREEIQRANEVGNISEMVQVEMKYGDIWMEELKIQCEKFASMLTEERKQQFLVTNRQWIDVLEEEFNIIIDTYVETTGMGPIFQLDAMSQRREFFRERVLYIESLYEAFSIGAEE